MQTILGSGGAISAPLARALAEYTDRVRCVSRKPHALPSATSTVYEHFAADLLNAEATVAAVEGAEVVYVTAGLPYDTKIWRRDWPVLVDNVIQACAKTSAKLVFVDNVYALSEDSYGRMTEESPLDPPSEKGKVRKRVLDGLWAAHRSGSCEVLVARAADFYGPGIANSLLLEVIVKKLAAGSAAQWLGNPDVSHSFTYTPDAGHAVAKLGNTVKAFGQTWNLPTASESWTPREWVERTAAALGTKPKLQALPKWLWRALSFVNGDLRELYDVRQQVQSAYIFDSSKIERELGLRATSYEAGLAEVVAGLRPR